MVGVGSRGDGMGRGGRVNGDELVRRAVGV